MKITKTHLKELIKQEMYEYVSHIEKKLTEEGDDDKYTHIGYGRYKEKGSEEDENSPTFKKTDDGKYVPYKDDTDASDVGGPAHANVPKKKKVSKSKISANPFGDEPPFEPDPPKDEPEMDAGGPAHANVPRGAKTSAQAKGMKGAQDLAKSAIPNEKEKWDSDKFDDFYDGTPDEDLKKNVDNINNTHLKALEKFKKDGVEFADEEAASIKSDMIDDYIEKRFGLTRADDEHSEAYSKINDFVGDKEEEYYDKKLEKQTMDAAIKANKKMEVDDLNAKAEQGNGELIDTEHNGMLVWDQGDPDGETLYAIGDDGETIEIGYDEIVRFHNDDENGTMLKNVLGVAKDTTPKEKGGFEREADAADSRDVRNKVIDNIGKKAFDKLSYGERDQAYDDEFERQGFVKSGKKWVKKESKGSRITTEGEFDKMVIDIYDGAAQRALTMIRKKVMSKYKVGKKSPVESKIVTRKLVALHINNGLKELRNKTKEPGLKKAFQKIIDIRDKQIKKMKEGKLMLKDLLPERGKLKEGKRVQLKIPIRDRKKVVDILQKKLRLKITKDFDYGGSKGANFFVDLDKKFYNKVLELLIKNRIKVHGT